MKWFAPEEGMEADAGTDGCDPIDAAGEHLPRTKRHQRIGDGNEVGVALLDELLLGQGHPAAIGVLAGYDRPMRRSVFENVEQLMNL